MIEIENLNKENIVENKKVGPDAMTIARSDNKDSGSLVIIL